MEERLGRIKKYHVRGWQHSQMADIERVSLTTIRSDLQHLRTTGALSVEVSKESTIEMFGKTLEGFEEALRDAWRFLDDAKDSSNPVVRGIAIDKVTKLLETRWRIFSDVALPKKAVGDQQHLHLHASDKDCSKCRYMALALSCPSCRAKHVKAQKERDAPIDVTPKDV